MWVSVMHVGGSSLLALVLPRCRTYRYCACPLVGQGRMCVRMRVIGSAMRSRATCLPPHTPVLTRCPRFVGLCMGAAGE